MSVGRKSTKDKFMKKKIIMMLIVLITFSFIFISCTTEEADVNLNGTWVNDKEEFFFNNGEYTRIDDGTQYQKGTYKTEDKSGIL